MAMVLILTRCGHEYWVATEQPMNAEERQAEKDNPCVVCGKVTLTDIASN